MENKSWEKIYYIPFFTQLFPMQCVCLKKKFSGIKDYMSKFMNKKSESVLTYE